MEVDNEVGNEGFVVVGLVLRGGEVKDASAKVFSSLGPFRWV